MKALKMLKAIAEEFYKPILPYSSAKKEEFLGVVREKVDYYKPRIEDKCEVDLGEVEVKDHKRWHGDFLRDKLEEIYEMYEERNGKKCKGLEKAVLDAGVHALGTLLTVPIQLNWSLKGLEMQHYDGNVYVPFYLVNRVAGLEERRRIVDQVVVHELSHKLWDCLQGTDLDNSYECRLWSEGFACYCSDVYFLDIYPYGVEVNEIFVDVYRKGKMAVARTVEVYGVEKLFEIPSKWKEIDWGRMVSMDL